MLSWKDGGEFTLEVRLGK